MSGTLRRAYFSLPPPEGLPELLSPAEQRKRLGATLVLSVLLHMLAALMPSPGTGSREPAVAAPALEVRLQRREAAPPVVGTAVPPPPAVVPPPAAAPAPPASPPSAPLSRGLDVLPIPARPYFTTDRLTMPPRPTAAPALNVPRHMAQFVTGRVTVKVWINELGGVDEVEVERSNLPPAVSAHAAAAFRKLHFLPGEVDGRAVGVLLRVEIAYVDGRAVPP